MTFVSLGLLTTLASADPRGPSPATPAIPQYPERAVCNGVNRCFAHARLAPDGSIQRTAVKPGDLPPGFGPTDLQSAYHIALPATTTATVAVIDAYGYPNLESDLATYRSTFSLPACSVASGCLTILNASGQTSPLPQEPPAQDDWTIETALDVDMVSAACPGCKIIVVEANDDTGDGLLTNNDIAAMMGATTISNSWGGPERIYEDSSQTLSSADAHVTHPGIAVFASAGDAGYQANGANFPTSSDHVISVGGTSLVNNGAGGRGWAESAWNLGGSSCSAFFAQPPWQKSSACSMRAYADVSAVGDPNTGVAVFNNGPSGSGWSIEGGTSLASPLVAAMFAQAGLGSSASSNFPYVNSGMFFDVTTGNNGSCGNSAICNAGLDWDGPTGIGSPIYPALAGTAKVPTLKVDPAPNQAVPDGFSATVTCTPTDSAHVTEVDVYVDGSQIGSLTAPPFVAKVPAGLPQGSHELYVVCELSSLATARADYTIDEVAACKTAGDCPKTGDICFDDACIPGKDLPNGLGAPCTDGSGCASGLCTGSDGLGTGSGSGSNDAGKVCTIDCDSNNACPSGFACTGSDSDGNPMCIEKPSSGGGCDSGGDGLPVVPLALGAGVLAFVLARRRTA